MRFLGRGSRDPGKARLSPPNPDDKDSASTKWMRHYIINDSRHGDFGCPECFVADTAGENHFCPEGLALRRAALDEMKAIPSRAKKPAATPFNPSIEGKRA
jgi:hypothetical protein